MLISILFASFASLAAALGGLTAIVNRDRLHRILGLAAGIILGVVAFDLLPEIFELAHEAGSDPVLPMVALTAGFLIIHIVEKLVAMHPAHDEYKQHDHPNVGLASAIALVGHSLLDGIGIGLAFAVGNEVGFAVALAVIAHRFADGLTAVSLMLSHRNTLRKTLVVLAVMAVAPIIGALLASVLTLDAVTLSLYLGFFAGTFLYIGAGDILPEAHSKHPSLITMLLTVLGVVAMFVVTRFV